MYIGSAVVECLTLDQGDAGSSLTGGTALWSLSKNINPSLVLVQPRKTRPCLTVRLLMALVCGVFCEFVTFPLVSWVRCGT